MINLRVDEMGLRGVVTVLVVGSVASMLLAIPWLAILGVGSVWDISRIQGAACLLAVSAEGVGFRVASSSHLSISVAALVALPGHSQATTVAVVVGWGRAVPLLLLVVLDKHELPDGRDEEEEDGNDCNSKGCSVEGAGVAKVESARSRGVAGTSAERGVDDAFAGVCTVAGVVGDCRKAACEEDVEKDGDEAEEGDAAQTEGQEDTEDGVEDGSTAHALNCFLPCRNVGIVVGEDCEEVGINAQDDGSSAEFENAKTCGAEAQEDTTDSHSY